MTFDDTDGNQTAEQLLVVLFTLLCSRFEIRRMKKTVLVESFETNMAAET